MSSIEAGISEITQHHFAFSFFCLTRITDSEGGKTSKASHKEIDSDSNSGDNRIVLIELNLPYATILKAGEKISKHLCDQKFCY